ncbi:hypothetical protein [Hymenobacter sp. B1770]|uniref:hypothetical protein n=1 Tax=Hymenobacter sp. B1770 TaxID=1718788 RepID=UPI003CEE963E
MVKALLLLVLMIPALPTRAQTPLPSRKAVLPAPPNVEQALNGLMNPRLLHVPQGTVLYRQLRDTLGNGYARPLPPGDWDLRWVAKVNPRWLAVRWLKGSAPYAAGDTALYYMPAIKGWATIIQL